MAWYMYLAAVDLKVAGTDEQIRLLVRRAEQSENIVRCQTVSDVT